MKFFTLVIFILTLSFLQQNLLVAKGVQFDGYDDFAIIPDCPAFHAKNIAIHGSFTLNSDKSLKSGENSTRQFIIFKKNTLENFNEAFAVYYNQADSSLWATFSSKDGIQTNISSGSVKVVPESGFDFQITVKNGIVTMQAQDAQPRTCKLKGGLDYGNGPVYLGGRYSHPADPGEYEGKFNGEINSLSIYNLDTNTEFTNIGGSEVLNLDFNSSDGETIADNSNYGNNGLFFKGKSKTETDVPQNSMDLEIFPNPVGRTGKVKFNNVSEGQVTLSILDVTGKIIKHVDLGIKPVGITEADFNTSGIANGEYLAIIECKEQSQKQVFVLSK